MLDIAERNVRLGLPLIVSGSLAYAYERGSTADDQHIILKDSKGGKIVIDGTDPGFTEFFSLQLLGNVNLGAGQVVASKPILIGDSPYNVLDTDYFLEVQSDSGTITVVLPALTGGAQPNGRIIAVKDSGYNAPASYITLVRGDPGDKIENINANYVINTSGICLWLKANTTTNNWEFI